MKLSKCSNQVPEDSTSCQIIKHCSWWRKCPKIHVLSVRHLIGVQPLTLVYLDLALCTCSVAGNAAWLSHRQVIKLLLCVIKGYMYGAVMATSHALFAWEQDRIEWYCTEILLIHFLFYILVEKKFLC